MTYDELLKLVRAAKDPSYGIPAPRPYYRLLFDPRTEHIIPVGQWRARTAKNRGLSLTSIIDEQIDQDDMMRFMPGNICQVRVPANTFCLAGFGIPGKFEARTSIKTEYTYILDWYTKYECVPNMQLRMSDGKPVNARPLDKVRISKLKYREVMKIRRQKKEVYLALIKLGSRSENYKRIWPHTNVNERRMAWLSFFVGEGDRGWLDLFTSEANAFNYDNKDDKESYAKAFDRMWRYDQAAVFRTLGVTY